MSLRILVGGRYNPIANRNRYRMTINTQIDINAQQRRQFISLVMKRVQPGTGSGLDFLNKRTWTYPVTDYPLPNICCQLSATNYPLPTICCQLSAAKYLLPTIRCHQLSATNYPLPPTIRCQLSAATNYPLPTIRCQTANIGEDRAENTEGSYLCRKWCI